MKTQNPPKKKKLEIKKQKSLFDHLDSIRISKDPVYYDSLSESEKKGFNHWAILHGLSQDINLIPLVSHLWQDGYYDKIPSALFYKILVDLVPKNSNRLYWTKKSKKTNSTLVEYISKWYSISNRESETYVDIFMSNDDGINEMASILMGFGLSEKECEKMLIGESKNE